MAKKFVTVKGKVYYARNGKLDLRLKKIADITEIKGLDNLVDLWYLNLTHNKIRDIRGLEHLKNLRELDLTFNMINEIKGFQRFANLQKLYLKGNPIRDDEKHLVEMGKLDAQEIVKYCQEKVKRATANLQPTVENYIVDRAKIYTSISFKDIASKFEVPVNSIQEICEKMLLNKKLEGYIDPIAKAFIIRNKDTQKSIPQTSSIEKYVAVYDTIGLNLIAEKFAIDEDTVEDMLLDLIHSGRIKGTLTLVEGVKTFVKTKEPIAVSKEPVVISRDVGGKTKYFSVPSECPHCGQFLTADEYTWVDMMKVKCTHCGGVIDVNTKEF